jgi:hypothetical protein
VEKKDAERRARHAFFCGWIVGALVEAAVIAIIVFTSCAPTSPPVTVDDQRIEQQREHAARDAAFVSARDEYTTTSDPYGGAFYVRELKVFTKNVAWFKDITTDWPYQKALSIPDAPDPAAYPLGFRPYAWTQHTNVNGKAYQIARVYRPLRNVSWSWTDGEGENAGRRYTMIVCGLEVQDMRLPKYHHLHDVLEASPAGVGVKE